MLLEAERLMSYCQFLFSVSTLSSTPDLVHARQHQHSPHWQPGAQTSCVDLALPSLATVAPPLPPVPFAKVSAPRGREAKLLLQLDGRAPHEPALTRAW